MLAQQVTDRARPRYDGGFSVYGRTTYTATCLEGLLAARSFLPADHGVRSRIEAAAPRGISFLVRAQVREGPFAGAMPRVVAPWKGDTPEIKDFNRRAAEVRIDYVQHSLCAMIRYQRRGSGG